MPVYPRWIKIKFLIIHETTQFRASILFFLPTHEVMLTGDGFCMGNFAGIPRRVDPHRAHSFQRIMCSPLVVDLADILCRRRQDRYRTALASTWSWAILNLHHRGRIFPIERQAVFDDLRLQNPIFDSICVGYRLWLWRWCWFWGWCEKVHGVHCYIIHLLIEMEYALERHTLGRVIICMMQFKHMRRKGRGFWRGWLDYIQSQPLSHIAHWTVENIQIGRGIQTLVACICILIQFPITAHVLRQGWIIIWGTQ